MAARDDSVIRGSLITCLILLVLSIALNIFLYLQADTARETAAKANETKSTVQNEIRSLTTKFDTLKAMLGKGQVTEADLEDMRAKNSTSGDPTMQEIEQQFAIDMSLFDASVPATDRNYPNLQAYLNNTIRQKNDRVAKLQSQVESIRTDATADVSNARKAQTIAEETLADAQRQISDLDVGYKESREKNNAEKEKIRDTLKIEQKRYAEFQQKAKLAQDASKKENSFLKNTVDSQRKKLETLNDPQFEVTQGQVVNVLRAGEFVNINLGSADQLYRNTMFGIIDRDETRLKDAEVKANIVVTNVIGPHLSQARVVRDPELGNPLIPGDKVYSPFWSPGRTVKIALAGVIDIDGDGRPDNEAIKGQIYAAGAEVAAELTPDGVLNGELTPDVRFLVVGDEPEVRAIDSLNPNAANDIARSTQYGDFLQEASNVGITRIPVFKLSDYLRQLDETLTTPLASGVRAEDFDVDVNTTREGRLPNDISDTYKTQQDTGDRTLRSIRN